MTTKTTQAFMVTSDVVAQVLNISVSAVYQLARQDKLPITGYKFGNSLRFKRSDLEEFCGATLSDILGESE